MKVYELLDTPDKWCKSVAALDKDGKAVLSNTPGAVSRCVVAAIHVCYPITKTNDGPMNTVANFEAKNKLIRQLNLNSLCALFNFNDDPATTHEQLLTALKAADV